MSLSSSLAGVAALGQDYAWQTTAEGDYVVLLLQTARFLMKTRKEALAGVTAAGPVDYLNALRDRTVCLVRSAPAAATDKSQFDDLDYLRVLFRFRALAAVATVGEYLDGKTKTLGADEAWNACSVQLVVILGTLGSFVLIVAI
jgi:hypothetical protein